MEKRKGINPDAAVTTTVQERALCRALVPAYLWNQKRDLISFRATKFRGKSLSAIAQQQWVRGLSERRFRKAPLIVIGSEPTDTGALHLAYYILIEYMKRYDRDTAVLDAAQFVSRLETYPGCAVIHNILDKATSERVQQVRDLITRFHYTYKLVVVGGTKDPEKWATARAALYPDVVLRVKDLTPEELRNY